MSIGIALVTGSAQGIGRAISLRLADDGFDVAVNDIPSNQPALDSLVDEIRAKGRQAVAVPADVTQEEQVKEMVAKAVKDLGGLDVVRRLLYPPTPNSSPDIASDGSECRNLPFHRLCRRECVSSQSSASYIFP